MKYTLHFIICCTALWACMLAACTDRGPNAPMYTQAAEDDSTNKLSGGLENTQPGKELFRQKCMACHGVNGDARNNNAADLTMTRLDSLGIAYTVLNGRGTMPPFRGAIADSDLAHIIAYVRTLRANSP